MSQIHPIRLPDCFYLPRVTRFGFEIRDVMPWKDGVAYVTDGVCIGAQLRSGHIDWFLRSKDGSGHASRYHLDLEMLPDSIRVHLDPHDLVQTIWRDNARVWAELSAAGTRGAAA